MRELLPHAEKIAVLLKKRKETVAIAESSAGGLIAAALLAVPGASAYFAGGGVLYSRAAWRALKDFYDAMFAGATPATETNALVRARIIRERFGATWGIGETGAAGPTGGGYGNAVKRASVHCDGGRGQPVGGSRRGPSVRRPRRRWLPGHDRRGARDDRRGG